MIPASLFDVHPLHGSNHRTPEPEVALTCRFCQRISFSGPAKMVLEEYREHVVERHIELLDECGCCSCLHRLDYYGDCRNDWERF